MAMADWISLTEVAVGSRGAQRVVALRSGRQLPHAQFVADVGCWQAAFTAVPGTSVAIHAEDGYLFATALFGAWHANKVAVLPGDAQPATLERLRGLVSAVAGDLPGSLQ